MRGAFDLHTHLPGRAFGTGRWETGSFLAMLDRAGIDRAVVMTVDGLFFDVAANNDALVAQAAEAPDRLIPFGSVDPYADDAVRELRRCVEELGCRGLKLHPPLQGFSPLLDQYMGPLAAEAERLGIPILFHDGTPAYSTPLQIVALLDDFPQLRVILGHGGRWDLWAEVVAAANRHPNCFVCLCGGEPPAVFARILREVDYRQVMIGTDAGWGKDEYLARFRMEVLRAMLADFPEEVQDAVLTGNAERLLDIAPIQ